MKKYLAIIFLVTILLGLAYSTQAITTIVKDYPEIPGATRPGEAESQALPKFIQYIFYFALGISGLVGMVAIIMGAFGYITSAGNPQHAAEAKSKILSALLGLLLLLGSWVLLNLINPDLLRLGVTGEIATGPKGDYACYCCCYMAPLIPDCTPDNRIDCERNTTSSQADQNCNSSCDSACSILNHKYQIKAESCD